MLTVDHRLTNPVIIRAVDVWDEMHTSLRQPRQANALTVLKLFSVPGVF